MMGICHYKFVQTHRIYNISEPYGLWVIMMCQKMFTLGKKKKTPKKQKVLFWWVMWIPGETMHVWGRRFMGNICIFLQFCCTPKTALKKKSLKKKIGGDTVWNGYRSKKRKDKIKQEKIFSGWWRRHKKIHILVSGRFWIACSRDRNPSSSESKGEMQRAFGQVVLPFLAKGKGQRAATASSQPYSGCRWLSCLR